jgi:hypothetical protein
MRWLVLAGLVGCYSPTVHPGAPCGRGGACPRPLTCSAQNTCEAAGSVVDASADSPAVQNDAPAADACASCVAPVNDLPDNAIDVSAGGDFTADLTDAHDDASKPNTGSTICGAAGGLDVFYKITLAADETIYLDTFGSDFDTVIRVFHGACAGGAAPNNVVCHDNANNCNSVQTVWLGTMRAGDNCIVVDGVDGTQTGHSLKLRVERGGRTGTPIIPPGVISGTQSYTMTGDTTNAGNTEDGSCSQHGSPDQGYAFSLCPGVTQTVGATTCNATTAMTPWDTALWARGPGGELACQDDDMAACPAGGGFSTISFSATGNHLFWVIVDGAGGTPNRGPYQVDLNFQ